MTPDSLPGAIILGAVQGIAEWIPVSSEGAVAAAYALAFDRPVSEAVRYALWLHLGTAFAAIVYFRAEIASLLRELMSRPTAPSPVVRFLVTATLVSAAVGLPLLLLLDEVSSRLGAVALALIGVFLIVTGVLQLYSKRGAPPHHGMRSRFESSARDGALAGIAQGVAVLPGLSRSGSTVALLLARGLAPRDALVLSFLMSIPASIGASVFAGLDAGLFVNMWALVGLAVAALTGLATLRLLMAVAARLNFGRFVVVAGAAIIAAGVWELVR